MITLIRKAQLLKLLGGISAPTLYRMLKAGLLPMPIQVSPGVKAWRSDEIEAFLEGLGRALLVEPAELTAARVKASQMGQPKRRGRPRKFNPTEPAAGGQA